LAVSTAPAPLVMSPDFARQIEREGSAAYPNECCGFLYGRDAGGLRVVQRVEPVTNSYDAGEQYHRFSIEPRELMRAEKTAAAEGLAVIGFYHSHPDHPARPSETDRAAAWPYYSYVIVSIAKREPIDMTSWLLDEESGTFVRQDVLEEPS
jgi:proteasome lid subunit RPN8/RPN11